jgi:dihydroorotate dehydrogenase electron transfer subunit
MKKNRCKARIISNKKIRGPYFKMVLQAPLIAASAVPGQFAMLKTGNGQSLSPLLRRPLGIHGAKGDQIEILYEAVGQGTKILAQSKPGALIDLLGPLGNGFDLRLPPSAPCQSVLVAGGMGVAPLVFLARRLAAGKSQGRGKALVLIGAKTKNQILCEKEFKNIGCNVKIATEDGSAGFAGRVTALLEKQLQTADYRLSAVYACGPRPMLREIIRISREKNIPAEVSLEAHMACGIGACLGCAVDTKNGYKRVCQDGPVFKTENLIY